MLTHDNLVVLVARCKTSAAAASAGELAKSLDEGRTSKPSSDWPALGTSPPKFYDSVLNRRMNEDEVQLMRLSFGPVFVVNNYEITVGVVNFELFTGIV